MREQVIVRAYGGTPLVLEIEAVGQGVVYLTNKESRQAQLGAIGYPLEDVFTFSAEAWRIITTSGDWKRMERWKAAG